MNRKDLKDLFIPCEENKFKPNFLERASMGIMLVLVLLTFTLANIHALVWIGSDWMVSTILPAVIVDLTNEERTDGTLGTLNHSDVLAAAAKLKAEDMAKNEYFAHDSPTGVTPWYWFDQVSYDFVYAGENLAVRFTDSGEVVDAWMKSPAHRDNILNGNYTEIGVGTAKGTYKGTPTIFVVQLFGTPRAHAVTQDAVLAESTSTQVALSDVAEEENANNVLGENVVVPSVDESDKQSIPESVVVAEQIPAETVDLVDQQESTGMAMYSDLATTSRHGVPATIDANKNQSAGSSQPLSSLERTAVQPGVWLQFVYSILALIVIVALILSIVIEWRKQNPIQIAYAGGMLAAMALLFYVHILLTSGVTIV